MDFQTNNDLQYNIQEQKSAEQVLVTQTPASTAPVQEGTSVAPVLAERLSRALSEVEPAILDGHHAYLNYSYATIGQIRAIANRALARAGVAVVPSILQVGREARTSEKGKPIQATVVRMSFHILAPEGQMSVAWVGESEDTSDKGLAKAITASTKSFLLNFLLIPLAQAEEERDTRPEERDTRPEGKEPSNGDRQGPSTHWISRRDVRTKFWTWIKGTLGLSEQEVHQALGVDSIYNFQGTMAEAKEILEARAEEKKEQGGVAQDALGF